MAIYLNNPNGVERVKELDFKLEKDIQRLCEENLQSLFGLVKVKSEFSLNGFRIDTLAFDPQTKAFVIIEYKRDKNFSVIDQGYAYLSLLLNNKAEFVLSYSESRKGLINKSDVDWPQTRVIFVSPGYTLFQKQSINFKDLPIELWEIKLYSNSTISLEQIIPVANTESIGVVSKKSTSMQTVEKQLDVYSEEDHLNIADDGTVELYEKFKAEIYSLGDKILIKPKKHYIAFVRQSNFVDVTVQKRSLKISINVRKGELNDPHAIARDVSNVGHWGNGDYELRLFDTKDLKAVMELIQQSYEKN